MSKENKFLVTESKEATVDESENSTLHEACSRCDLRSVQRILSQGNVEIDATDNLGMTPLYLVCKAKEFSLEAKAELAEFLLDHGADPDFRNPVYEPTRFRSPALTPLFAAEKRNPKIADLIKERKELEQKDPTPSADVAVVVDSGAEALKKSTVKKKKNKERKPQDTAKKPTAKASEDDDFLNDAIKEAQEARAKMLPQQQEQQRLRQNTEISEICAQEIAEVLKIKFPKPKLRGQFNINAKDGNGDTILHHVCKIVNQDNKEVVKILLLHPRIELNSRNNAGMTPLLVACRFGNVDVVNVLLDDQRGIDCRALDDDGNSALHYLAAYRRDGITNVAQQITNKVLQAADGVNFLNIRSRHDLTPAAMCCSPNGNSEILEILLNCGAVDKECVVDQRQNNRLFHTACCCNNLDSARVLIGHGVDVGARNREGKVGTDLVTNSTVRERLSNASVPGNSPRTGDSSNFKQTEEYRSHS